MGEITDARRRGNGTGGLPPRIHLLGAGGAGLSGAARFLHEAEHGLSGLDGEEGPHLALLRKLGIEVEVEGNELPPLDPEVQLIARSAAIPDAHPHVVEALGRGIPVIKYAELLGRIAPEGRTLAVAGTHGKTTTSWMLYHVLRGASEAQGESRAPRALVGGICRREGSNAIPGGADGWFSVEACEYDRSFHHLRPFGAIVTNVEADHLDCYGTLEAVEEAFATFVRGMDPGGVLVLGSEVCEGVEAAAPCRVVRLGRDVQRRELEGARGCAAFRIEDPAGASPRIQLSVPGDFNGENAALAYVLAKEVGAPSGEPWSPDDLERGARTLGEFVGAQRRFEPWGEVGGVELVHDYAHHPTEVESTLRAARRVFPGRSLHVLFQPHQHSRTARFLGGFVESLAAADRVVVARVYGARVHTDEVSAGAPEIVEGLRSRGVDAEVGGELSHSVQRFAEGLASAGFDSRVPKGSATAPVGLVLGAGDIETIRDELHQEVALRRTP